MEDFKEKIQRAKDWLKEHPTVIQEIKKKFLVSIYYLNNSRNLYVS